jgi:hypothetical protein
VEKEEVETANEGDPEVGIFVRDRLGIEDTQFKLSVSGVGYNYEDDEYFDPSEDSVIKVVGRNDSEARIALELEGAELYANNVRSGEPGSTKQVHIGPTPIAGLKADILLDGAYGSPVSGFVTFETEGGLSSDYPVTLNPGTTSTVTIPIAAGREGRLSFKTFDFITSPAHINAVPRLTVGEAELGVSASCMDQRVVMIAFDNSGSMNSPSDANDVRDKIEIELSVLKELVSGFGGNTKFSLMALSSCPYVAVYNEEEDAIDWEMTCEDDVSELLDKKFMFSKEDRELVLEGLDENIYGSGSSIQGPILFSIGILNNSISKNKRIIALTDGEASFDFEEYNKSLASDIKINTIGIFSEGKSRESDELTLLKRVADIGGGEFYQVSDYRDIYRALESSAKSC